MKTILPLSLGVAFASALLVTGCENTRGHERHSGSSHSSFDRKTEQTFNPETNNYEKQPPYGPRSNKPLN